MLDHVMIKGYQGVSIGFVGQFLAHLGLEFVWVFLIVGVDESEDKLVLG